MKIFIDANLMIYLNASTDEKTRHRIDTFFMNMLKEELYTNMLVIDEVLYVSRIKFNVPYEITFGFLDGVILPYVEIIPVDRIDYEAVKEFIDTFDLRPSDAIHVATMRKSGIRRIVSEDKEFDRVKGIERMWLE